MASIFNKIIVQKNESECITYFFTAPKTLSLDKKPSHYEKIHNTLLFASTPFSTVICAAGRQFFHRMEEKRL